MMREQDSERQLVVVFKKEVEPGRAREIIDRSGIAYREGMDSSRGKIYFYNTGPKFTMLFESTQDKEVFLSRHEGLPEIHELYTPDWTKQKD